MKLLQATESVNRVLGTRPMLILFAYWAVTQSVIYGFSGVMTSVDTPLYTQSANDLLTQFTVEDTHAFWYVSYSLTLALILNFTNSLLAVVVFQVLLSGIALRALYKAVVTTSNDKNAAFLACFLYVFWFEIHTWNVFIYTESLFISSSIITFYLLVHSRTYSQYVLAVAFILFSCLIRPVGISLLAASMVYLFIKLQLPTKPKMIASIIVTGLTFILLNKMLESYELVTSYAKGEIIYPDVTFLVDKIQINSLPTGDYPLLVFAEFILEHPVYFIELCAIKLTLFFAHVKPYFSFLHNGYIVIVLYPLYFLAVKGYRFAILDKSVKGFILSFVGFQAVTVMVTSENWDGRFLMPALPFIFILSAVGITHFLRTRISAH